MLNEIRNQDCLEYMKTLPDNYFDLVITDPPYGINASNSSWNNYSSPFGGVKNRKPLQKEAKSSYKVSDWDKKTPSKEIFKEILRVSKNQIIFGGNYFIEHLHNSYCWIVWDKANGDNDFADCELAWTSFNTAVRKFKYRWNGMLQEEMGLHKDKREHPTQKPVALGRWLLDNYAEEGNKIFDPFAGSGSFLVACKQKGFEFVGCEIDKDYCEVIKKRLNQRGLSDFT